MTDRSRTTKLILSHCSQDSTSAKLACINTLPILHSKFVLSHSFSDHHHLRSILVFTTIKYALIIHKVRFRVHETRSPDHAVVQRSERGGHTFPAGGRVGSTEERERERAARSERLARETRSSVSSPSVGSCFLPKEATKSSSLSALGTSLPRRFRGAHGHMVDTF